jgi:hypothetical protein
MLRTVAADPPNREALGVDRATSNVPYMGRPKPALYQVWLLIITDFKAKYNMRYIVISKADY